MTKQFEKNIQNLKFPLSLYSNNLRNLFSNELIIKYKKEIEKLNNFIIIISILLEKNHKILLIQLKVFLKI